MMTRRAAEINGSSRARAFASKDKINIRRDEDLGDFHFNKGESSVIISVNHGEVSIEETNTFSIDMYKND